MLNQGADVLYTRAFDRGQRGQLWSALTGRPRSLLALDEIDRVHALNGHRDVGVQCVPIRQIRGSESRAGDFDRDFNPLWGHNRERWLGVARARLRGKQLPPVELVRVGEAYFVRDGHHRISVARALGQRDIDARVTVWQVEGITHGRGEVGLCERTLRGLRGLVGAAGTALRGAAVSRTGVEAT